MQDLIGYDKIIEKSMRSVIHTALKKIENSGLPGAHHFVISFITKFKGVKIGQELSERYPEEMTIALQHQFKNLKVDTSSFSITLSFSGQLQKLQIPFAAITSFADPSINFALKFSHHFNDLEESEENQESQQGNQNSKEEIFEVDTSQRVISLDAFRKSRKNHFNKNKNQ